MDREEEVRIRRAWVGMVGGHFKHQPWAEGQASEGWLTNEWRFITVRIWNSMQLSRCDSYGPTCKKIEKLQSFLLHKACLLLSWVGEGVKLDIPYKALLGTQKSEEERREMQYASLGACFRMLIPCLISSECIISIIPTLVRMQLLLFYHPKEYNCLHEKKVQFPSAH